MKAKLFAGYLLTSEVRMHLNKSDKWKDAQLLPAESPNALTEMRYTDEYAIGRFLPEEKITLSKLKSYKEEIAKTLQEYCPKLEVSNLKFQVYSQYFVY